jgi:hypothetical protein
MTTKRELVSLAFTASTQPEVKEILKKVLAVKDAKRDPFSNEPKLTKPRLTPAQKKAIDAYNFALSQEDRYLGSVFANQIGQKRYEQLTQEAYDNAKRVLTPELALRYL